MIYCALAKAHGWGPEVVKKMTIAQQCMYLTGLASAKSGAAPGFVKFDNPYEALAYARKLKAQRHAG